MIFLQHSWDRDIILPSKCAFDGLTFAFKFGTGGNKKYLFNSCSTLYYCFCLSQCCLKCTNFLDLRTHKNREKKSIDFQARWQHNRSLRWIFYLFEYEKRRQSVLSSHPNVTMNNWYEFWIDNIRMEIFYDVTKKKCIISWTI